MKLANLEFHMLVVDKMELSAEKHDQLILLDSHRQRLSLALVSKHSCISPLLIPTINRPLAEGILEKHRELAQTYPSAKSDGTDKLMEKIKEGEDPATVLDEQFLSYALNICELSTKRMLGTDMHIIYRELHAQITKITNSNENILELAKYLNQGKE